MTRRESSASAGRSPSVYSVGNSSSAEFGELPSLYPSAAPSLENLAWLAQGQRRPSLFPGPEGDYSPPHVPSLRHPQRQLQPGSLFPSQQPQLSRSLASTEGQGEPHLAAHPFNGGWAHHGIPLSATYHSGFPLRQPQPQPHSQQMQTQQAVQSRRYVHYSGYSPAPRWPPRAQGGYHPSQLGSPLLARLPPALYFPCFHFPGWKRIRAKKVPSALKAK